MNTSKRELTKNRFAWLDQVLADHGLPASAFKVAYFIAGKFNAEMNGIAWPSCETIAAAIGMSKGTAHDMVGRLQARGHLGLDPGRQGRGHSNRYHMILKGQQADLFESDATGGKGQPADRKGQRAERKGQPAEQNSSTKSSKNSLARLP